MQKKEICNAQFRVYRGTRHKSKKSALRKGEGKGGRETDGKGRVDAKEDLDKTARDWDWAASPFEQTEHSNAVAKVVHLRGKLREFHSLFETALGGGPSARSAGKGGEGGGCEGAVFPYPSKHLLPVPSDGQNGDLW